MLRSEDTVDRSQIDDDVFKAGVHAFTKMWII